MLVFSLYHPQKPNELIDIFIQEPIPFAEADSRKSIGTLGKTSVNLMGIQDLITLKKRAGRAQDIQDIAFLEKALRDRSE